MEAITSDPVPAASRRWLRRGIDLAAILLVGALLFPTLIYELAKNRLERVTGPLEASRFDPPSLPAGNAGDRLRGAAQMLAFSPDERNLLAATVKGGPAALRAQRQRLASLLERNREAL